MFDAPIGEAQAKWTIEAARARYPGKPVKYLVLDPPPHGPCQRHAHLRRPWKAATHRASARAPSRIIRAVLAAPHRVHHRPAGSAQPRQAEIVEVDGQWTAGDGRRQVARPTLVDNPHAEAMLIGYRAGRAARASSPTCGARGATSLGAKPTPGQAALVAAVRKYGIDAERFAGGHGSTAPYGDLAKIADAK
ncbi:MAG: hypothetical protein MZW92_11730 [Comamonadaceae bacterium]|nr:hypothetical protein [Comamonadaceae bacterium]